MKQKIPNAAFGVILLVVVVVAVAAGFAYMNRPQEVNINMEERKRRMGDYMKQTTAPGQGNAQPRGGQNYSTQPPTGK